MNKFMIGFLILMFISIGYSTSTVLVLDASGSMNDCPGEYDYSCSESKLDIAKGSAKEFLSGVQYGDEVALIVFYDCYDIVTEVEFTTDMAYLRSNVDSITASGSTPISGAIEYAEEYIVSSKSLGASIILLTDGEETCDYNTYYANDGFTEISSPEYAAINAVAGSVSGIYVIGFTTGDSQQLQDVAVAGNGQYFKAQNSQQLTQSLNSAYNQVSNDDMDLACCGPMFILVGLIPFVYVSRR